MGSWDSFPSGNQHKKKPLTREQLRKLKENYAKANDIIAHVEKLEKEEKEKNQEKHEETLNELFL